MAGTAGVALLATLWLAWACPVQAAPAWQKAPVIPKIQGGVKQRLLFTVARGAKLGMRAGVFAKVGDSNTEMSSTLYGLGCRRPRFGWSHRFLAPVARRYTRTELPNPLGFPDCAAANSFSRRSVAAKTASWATWPSTLARYLGSGYYRPPADCSDEESPLICEIRLVRPRYALIMTGTNDIYLDNYFRVAPGSEIGKRLLPAIVQARARGVAPVLSTIPPVIIDKPGWQEIYDRGIARTNAGIFRLARARNVPLINLWRALTRPGMVNRGLSADGLHLGVFGAGDSEPSLDSGPQVFGASINFTAAGLKYGANRRNLITLMTLARLDRITG